MSPRPQGFSEDHIRAARKHLSKSDEIMAGLIQQVGDFTLKPDSGGYEILVRAILSQQISTAAARTIRTRLLDLLPKGRVRAEHIDQLSDDQLQSAGISRQKRSYLRDLTRCVLDGTINLRRIRAEDDEAAIAELIQVKGVGRWTAQMYLLFSLGRPDVFAPDDLGLRNAIVRLYGLSENATKAELARIAEPWSPWRSVASWYLWRSLEIK